MEPGDESDARRSTGAPVTRTYRALKGLAWIVVTVFYRRVDVTGDGAGASPGRPTIVAANHTNALADPVVMLAKLPGHPRFLAAGSWWKFAPARWLFRLAGVVPIYRRRDGGGADANTRDVRGVPRGAGRGRDARGVPRGRAAPRAVDRAAEDRRRADRARCRGRRGRRATSRCCPVGLVYEDRGRFRSQAAVQVGAPIPVDPWVEQYRADPRGAVRALTARGRRRVCGRSR